MSDDSAVVDVISGHAYDFRVEMPSDDEHGLVWLRDCTTHEKWYR